MRICSDALIVGPPEIDRSNLAIEYPEALALLLAREPKDEQYAFGLESSTSFHAPCQASCGRNTFDNICMLTCFILIEFCHYIIISLS